MGQQEQVETSVQAEAGAEQGHEVLQSLAQVRVAMVAILLSKVLPKVTRWVVVGARAVMSMLLETMPNTAEAAVAEAEVLALERQAVVHSLAVEQAAVEDTPQAVRLAQQAVCGVRIPQAVEGPLEAAVLEATVETTLLGVVTVEVEALVLVVLVLMEVQAVRLEAVEAGVAAEAIRQAVQEDAAKSGYGHIR